MLKKKAPHWDLKQYAERSRWDLKQTTTTKE